MKKAIAVLVLCAACAAPVKEEPKCHVTQCEKCEIPGRFIVKNQNGSTVELSQEEFMSLYRLAGRYVALRDSMKTVKSNVTVTHPAEDTYDVTIKLDDELSITATIKVDNSELNRLRAEMKRITTEEPKVTVKRLDDKQFKITMGVGTVVFSTVLDVDNIRGIEWKSLTLGVALGALAVAAYKGLLIIKAIAPFFAL